MNAFLDRQWVCTPSAYEMLISQGYVTHVIEWRHGAMWRLMVLA
jgi:hypothetical protein